MARILCIEDEAAIREDIVEELQSAGHETIEAANGKIGLDAILSHKPDLVLCDVTMPVMDGYQVLKNLRELHGELADLPFVFLSALADRKDVIIGNKLGADDYLTKPIDYEMLLACVESRLRQVGRMAERKKQQMVKLYRAVSEPDRKASTGDGPSAGHEDTHASPAAVCEASEPDVPGPHHDGLVAHREDLGALVSRNGGKLVTGRIQLVGLESIRQKFGDRWPAMTDRVYATAEKILRKRLSEKDAFSQDENGNFVVCFASLDESASAFKADAIAREVQETLIGKNGEPAPWEVAAETHTLKIAKEEVDQAGDLVGLISARLNKASERIKEAAKLTFVKIMETCELRTKQVQAKSGTPAPFAITEFDESTQSNIAQLAAVGGDRVHIAAEIDLLSLGQVTERICENLVKQSVQMLVSPVAYSSLDNKRQYERYRELCSGLMSNVRESLILAVTGVPGDLMPSRVTEVINKIRPFCRFLMVKIDKPQLSNIDPKTLRAAIIAIDFENLGPTLEGDQAKITKLIRQVHNSKARILVDKVPVAREEKRLFGLGVDFVAPDPSATTADLLI